MGRQTMGRQTMGRQTMGHQTMSAKNNHKNNKKIAFHYFTHTLNKLIFKFLLMFYV